MAFAAHPEFIYLTGDIQDDAPAAFLRITRSMPSARVLILSSYGGYIDPALIVAKEVRARGLSTYVAEGQECNSACAFIFLGGTERRLDGKLGVHQIATADNNLVEGQMALAEVFVTLRDFGVADGVISRMMATRPDQMHFFDRDEVDALGIEDGDPFAFATAKAPPANSTVALLLEASDDGITGATPYPGLVQWTLGEDKAHRPTIVATGQIAERKLDFTMVIRQRLPAEDRGVGFVIEVNFDPSNDFVGGAVAGLPGVLLKDEQLVQGVPLLGASARVSGNRFEMALSNEPEDLAANLDMLTGRRWIDLALLYATGKRAIITLEKDATADQVFKEAMDDWPAAWGARSKSSLLPLLNTTEPVGGSPP